MELIDIEMDSYDAILEMDLIDAHIENRYYSQYNYEIESGLEEYSYYNDEDYNFLLRNLLYKARYTDINIDTIGFEYHKCNPKFF